MRIFILTLLILGLYSAEAFKIGNFLSKAKHAIQHIPDRFEHLVRIDEQRHLPGPPAKPVIQKLHNIVNPALQKIKDMVKPAIHKVHQIVHNEHINKLPQPKIDHPKLHIPKIDHPKLHIPKIDHPKLDIPKIDLPKLDKLPHHKIDLPKLDELPHHKIDLPKLDKFPHHKIDLPKLDKFPHHKIDLPKLDKLPHHKIDIPKLDDLPHHKIELPKFDLPKIDLPKVHIPGFNPGNMFGTKIKEAREHMRHMYTECCEKSCTKAVFCRFIKNDNKFVCDKVYSFYEKTHGKLFCKGIPKDIIDAPVDDEPIDDEPVDDAPVDDQPIDEDPVKDEPVDDVPVDEDPVKDEPVKDGPVDDTPVDDQPIDEDPVKDEPVDDVPVDEEPVKDEPVKDDPVKDEPVKDDPVKDEPVKDQPVKDEPNDPKEGQTRGDPHMSTFDGLRYDYQGVCTYVLFTDGCNGTKPTFRVESITEGGVNKKDEPVARVAAATIQLLGDNPHTIHLYKGGNTMVDNKPLEPFDEFKAFELEHDGIKTELTLPGKFTVQWDGVKVIMVELYPKMHGNVCGLLGNADGNPENDMMMSNGKLAETVNEFGRSWIAPGSVGCYDK